MAPDSPAAEPKFNSLERSGWPPRVPRPEHRQVRAQSKVGSSRGNLRRLNAMTAGHPHKPSSKDTWAQPAPKKAKPGHDAAAQPSSGCTSRQAYPECRSSTAHTSHTRSEAPLASSVHPSVRLQAACFSSVGLDCCFFSCASRVAGLSLGARRRARTRIPRGWDPSGSPQGCCPGRQSRTGSLAAKATREEGPVTQKSRDNIRVLN